MLSIAMRNDLSVAASDRSRPAELRRDAPKIADGIGIPGFAVRPSASVWTTGSASSSSSLMRRSEEHTSELQSLMRISYAVFCLKKKINTQHTIQSLLFHSYSILYLIISTYLLSFSSI